MGLLAGIADSALEATIVGSFSRLGIAARRHFGPWPDPPRLDGKAVLITGASSGIGRAAAIALGRLGASVWLVGRDTSRLQEAADAAGPGAHPVVADIVDPAAVASLVSQLEKEVPALDGLVHNAGALFHEHRSAGDGTELTVATHIVAPFRLTWMLRDLLTASGRPAIVTVSSGGMYSEGFDLYQLEMEPDHYRGAVAYARAKRAQVVLAREWSRRLGIASHAMHPGWVKTPGVDAGLPRFSKLTPLFRTPDEGADTIVWLLATLMTEPGMPRTGFWHDRRLRGEYYRPGTRPDPAQAARQGEELWEWCAARAGI